MSIERILELLSQAKGLEKNATKVALLEEAVREADVLEDLQLQYQIRMDLIDAATFSGQEEKALVAFSWCLAAFDKHPGEFQPHSLLWKYKWILGQSASYPQISREQIVQMQDDFHERLQQLGYSLRPAHYMRWTNFMDMGLWDKTHEYFQKWQDAPRDTLADCRACERNRHVELLCFEQKDEEALTIAEPILQGRMRCAVIPHATLGKVLPSLIRLGRLDEASDYHRRGYRLIRNNPDFVDTIPYHQLHLLHINEVDKAFNLFRKHIEWAAHTADLHAKLMNYLMAEILFSRLAEEKDEPRKIALPKGLNLNSESNEHRPSELVTFFQEEVTQLRDRFNHRNGTDFYTELIHNYRELSRPVAQ